MTKLYKNCTLYFSKLYIAAAFFAFASNAVAQRVIGELENNMDQEMTPYAGQRDTSDQSGRKKEKIVPVDIHSWTIDPTFGRIRPAAIDTSMQRFHQFSSAEGINGHFNTLSNLGSPRINRIYLERPENADFIFQTPFDYFITPTDSFRYYNTKSPYMNLFYDKCGEKTTGFDHFKATFTTNAGKRFNFGALFDYLYGQGFYDNQSTSMMNASAWASYISDPYDLHLSYTHNYMKMGENGGITDESYITNPEGLARSYQSKDIPVWLDQTWMRQEMDILHLSHHYNLGFYRSEGEDSTALRDVFVPITSFFHTLDLRNNRRRYLANTTPDSYHAFDYLPSDTTNDLSRSFYVKNLFGISLREGFNKYAKAGVSVYIGHEYKNYQFADTLPSGSLTTAKHHLQRLLLGGQIIKSQGHVFHYDLSGELNLAGDYLGDFSLQSHTDVNFPLFRDTVQLALNAFLRNEQPNYFFQHFHSRHAWWDRDLDNTLRLRIEGVFSLPRTRSRLTAGLETIKNYAYLQATGSAYTSSSGETLYTTGPTVRQSSDIIQVLHLSLLQDFQLGILHFDNDITLQATSDSEALPLPLLSSYHNLYLRFSVVKNVLRAQLGADLKYFTSYYAPDYSPAVSQFMTQNPDHRIKIGNYPLISAYLNIDFKQLRAYIMYYHANQSDGRYFWAAGYPMNPSGIHFGFSWNFYD